jgi:CRP/FNR family transcriptional regulator, cyclic AMP receptor protein
MNEQQLKKYRVFNGLSDAQVLQISDIIHVKSFKKDEMISREGEEGDALYLLLKGSVEISKSLTLMVGRGNVDTREKSLIHLHAEDFPYFGEMAILRDGCRRSASVRTRENSTVAIIRRDDLLNLCDHDTGLGYLIFVNIAKRLAIHLDKANQDIAKLTTAFSLVLSG